MRKAARKIVAAVNWFFTHKLTAGELTYFIVIGFILAWIRGVLLALGVL